MGGKYSPHLTSEVTHLISRNTISDKYKVKLFFIHNKFQLKIIENVGT